MVGMVFNLSEGQICVVVERLGPTSFRYAESDGRLGLISSKHLDEFVTGPVVFIESVKDTHKALFDLALKYGATK